MFCLNLVTFCENYVTWVNKLEKLVDVLDFISIHTYPHDLGYGARPSSLTP